MQLQDPCGLDLMNGLTTKKNNEWRHVFLLADKFTQHNFQEVMEHEEFLLLPLTQLIDIISSGMPGPINQSL